MLRERKQARGVEKRKERKEERERIIHTQVASCTHPNWG